jgi:hypothetical protein
VFLAAFRSRSAVMPHCVQVQDLTARGFSPQLTPHPEHSRLEGNQPPTPATDRWPTCWLVPPRKIPQRHDHPLGRMRAGLL